MGGGSSFSRSSLESRVRAKQTAFKLGVQARCSLSFERDRRNLIFILRIRPNYCPAAPHTTSTTATLSSPQEIADSEGPTSAFFFCYLFKFDRGAGACSFSGGFASASSRFLRRDDR